MTITATALLRLPHCVLQGSAAAGLRLERIEDAVLLHTSADFGSDPDELAALLGQVLGEQLAEHDDARGVFVLPSVAKPAARSYDAVIAEVGEGGEWIPLLIDEGEAFGLPDGLGALGAVLGSMMQHMPQSLLDAAQAASRGDMQGLSQVSDQVAEALGHGPQGGLDLGSLTRMMAGGGLDFSSPQMQQLMSGLQEELARDPEKLQRLAAQLFGQVPGDGSDDEK